MARNLFGGSSDDYAVDTNGRPLPNRRIRFYTSAAMTTEITDLASDAAGTGTPLTVMTDGHGFWGKSVPVYSPDGVTVMYAGAADGAGNPPTYVVAVYTHTATSAASPLSAFYGDESMGAGTAPTLVLEPDRWTHDADGVACEVDAIVPNQVNILQDGLYSLTAQVFLFNAGTTGGSVTLRLVRGENFLQFGDEVGADPGGPEVDCALSLVTPLLAGDQLLLLAFSTGADNTGNVAQLLVCKLS